MGRSSFLSFREYVGRKVENLFHVKGRASAHDQDLIENIDKSWCVRSGKTLICCWSLPLPYTVYDHVGLVEEEKAAHCITLGHICILLMIMRVLI